MPNRPSWLTVGVLGLALTAGTYVVTVAVKFGQQESALAAQAARNQELGAERDRLLNVIGNGGKLTNPSSHCCKRHKSTLSVCKMTGANLFTIKCTI